MFSWTRQGAMHLCLMLPNRSRSAAEKMPSVESFGVRLSQGALRNDIPSIPVFTGARIMPIQLNVLYRSEISEVDGSLFCSTDDRWLSTRAWDSIGYNAYICYAVFSTHILALLHSYICLRNNHSSWFRLRPRRRISCLESSFQDRNPVRSQKRWCSIEWRTVCHLTLFHWLRRISDNSILRILLPCIKKKRLKKMDHRCRNRINRLQYLQHMTRDFHYDFR
jgi:hypothetical protein